MPARLNVDREQVRMLVLSVGVREAARRVGLKEDTVAQWSCRGRWLAQPDPTPVPPSVMRPVSDVIKLPADALAEVIAADGRATRIAAVRYARKAVEHAQSLSAGEALASAQDVKAVLQGLVIADGSWQQGGSQVNLQVNLLSNNRTPELE